LNNIANQVFLKKSLLLFLSISLSVVEGSFCFSQSVGINPIGTLPNQTAGLDVDFPSKGILVPRMAAAVRLAIVNPANALLVFDTDSDCFFFYKFSNSSWNSLCGVSLGGPIGTPTLYTDFVSSANTSSTSMQTLKSWTLPANTLTTDGTWIEIELFARVNIPLNPGTFQITIGGNVVYSHVLYISTGQQKQDFDCVIKFYRVNSTAQKSIAVSATPGFLAYTGFANHTFNLSNPLTIQFKAQNAAGVANTIIAESFVVRKIE
jgi:hypothetical protein